MKFKILLPLAVALGGSLALAGEGPVVAHYDGAPWHIQGEGAVMCPCAVPCPCRSNSTPTYGHCESAFYLHVRSGHYGAVNLAGVHLVEVGGDCAMCHRLVGALYFAVADTPAEQEAYEKLVASFSPQGVARFPFVRVVGIKVQDKDHHLLRVAVPGILLIVIDRNWGQPDPPMPRVAAPDHYANAIQYVQNLRYVVHDAGAHLNFDYSHRQANFRVIDVDVTQYQSKSMLIQFADGAGWFNKAQLRLIQEQHLLLPDLNAISRKAIFLERKHP